MGPRASHFASGRLDERPSSVREGPARPSDHTPPRRGSGFVLEVSLQTPRPSLEKGLNSSSFRSVHMSASSSDMVSGETERETVVKTLHESSGSGAGGKTGDLGLLPSHLF